MLGAFITVQTGSVFLMFGISAASLAFLNCGVENVPVTHHMALVGSAAAAAVMADGSGLIAGGMKLAVLVGGLFGLIAGLFGELFQRIFYSHGDTHWDPPAAAIAFGSFLIAVLAILGIFPGSSYVHLRVTLSSSRGPSVNSRIHYFCEKGQSTCPTTKVVVQLTPVDAF